MREWLVQSHPLSRQLVARLPGNTAIAVHAIDDYVGALFPVELNAIARAVPQRRREFSTGRLCARSVLRDLGHSSQAIPVGNHREPLWPRGIQGAITHDAGVCIAIGRKPDDIATLGIDLTDAAPLDVGLRDLICTSEERARINATPDCGIDPFKLVLSVKESLYKALFPFVLRYVDFKDVCIDLDVERGRWRSHLIDPGLRDCIDHSIEGRFLTIDRFIVTTAWSQA